jgi:ATP-binding cassette subfamily F protein uup
VDRIFEFDGNGHLQQYEGGYTDYIETKQKRFGETQMDLMAGKKVGADKKTSDAGEGKSSSKDWVVPLPLRLLSVINNTVL